MRLLGLSAALLSAAAGADEPAAPAWDGVWQGTIGALPVRACLQQGGGDYAVGAYFYLSQNKVIRLNHDGAGSWSEHPGFQDASTGAWQIAPGPAGLSGTWQSGGKALPIALTRVAIGQSDSACSSRAFMAPRLRAVTQTRKPARENGITFTRITYHPAPWFQDVSITSFAFARSRPGDAAINTALQLDPNLPDGEADYAGCYSGQIGSLGIDGDFGYAITPSAIGPGFLTVGINSDTLCGGAHPNSYYFWRSYDRVTGKPINFARWFAGPDLADPAQDGDTSLPIPPALRRAAVRRMTFDEPECRDAVVSSDYWFVGLTAAGVRFTPSLPHVAMACTDDAVIPFAAVARYLTAAGKADLARLGLGRAARRR